MAKPIHETTHPACANCGAGLSGPFCSACGQSAHVGRLTGHDLVHEVWHGLTHADKGLVRLTLDLFRNPGATYRAYFGGQRKKYFSPLLYFLLSAGALGVLYPYVFDYEDHVTDMRNEFGRAIYHMIKYRSLVLLPVQIGLTWLAFHRHFNLAEVVFWLFCLGFADVARLLTLPAYFAAIRHKHELDYAFFIMANGLILWHLSSVFPQGNVLKGAYCLGLVLAMILLDFLLQGYLIFGDGLFGRPEFASFPNLLKAAYLP